MNALPADLLEETAAAKLTGQSDDVDLILAFVHVDDWRR